MLSRLFRPMALAAIAALGVTLAATPAAAQMGVPDGASSAQQPRSGQAARSSVRPGQATARPTSEQQHQRGMAEAPAVIQAAGVPCQLADAIWIGDIGTGAQARKGYEVVCTGSLGYVLVTGLAGAAPTQVDCLTAETLYNRERETNPQSTATHCTLPGNANPGQTLAPLLTAAHRTCTINNARAVGQAGTSMRYEVGCAEGSGFLIDKPAANSTEQPTIITCLEASASNVECQYSPRATLLAGVQRTIGSQTPACTATDVRWMGRPPGRDSEFIEVTCGSTGGYVAEIAANGSVAQWVTCGQAANIGGGCRNTGAAVAQNQDVTLYQASARDAHIDCPISGYRRLGIEGASGREVVELTCGTGRPGVVAYFPIPGRQSQPAEGIDCLRAAARNVPCRLTTNESLYPLLAQQMAAANSPCAVSAFRVMGRLGTDDMVEVACDAAQRGYVVALPVAQTSGIGRVLRCADAGQQGIGCQLPANRAGDRPRS